MTEPGDAEGIVRDYLTLGLRMGALVDGYVDSWIGDPRLARRVAAEPARPPADLADQAGELLRRLPDSSLDPGRRRFLDAQLRAVRCAAQRAAGRPMSFLDEVHTCFGVEIGLGDPQRYAALHDEISALLPGPGPLLDRVEAFYRRNEVPADRLRHAVETVSDALEERMSGLFGLPEEQQVRYEVVTGVPWNAFNQYHGGYRSTIRLNAAAGRTIAALPLMATHEAYPGHHTERCRKEAGLIGRRGHDEHRIALVNTPQCLVSEGTAEHAVTALIGPGWGEWTREVLDGQGVPHDGELVERLTTLVRELMPARQDAAVLLHDRGTPPDEVVDYLHRWLLLPRDRAHQMVTFLTDPLWRAYSVTYVEGFRLAGQYLRGRPVLDGYRTLLDEQLLPGDLIAS